MDDAKAGWDEVGDRFAMLAGLIRERYEANAGAEAAESGAEATEGAAEAAGRREEAEKAVRGLVDVLDRAFTAVGEAVRDPSFREEAKQAAGAIGEALGTTLVEVGNDIRRTFGGTGDEPPATPPGPGAPRGATDAGAPERPDGRDAPTG